MVTPHTVSKRPVPYHTGHPFSNDKGPQALPEMGVPLYCLFNPNSAKKKLLLSIVTQSNVVIVSFAGKSYESCCISEE